MRPQAKSPTGVIGLGFFFGGGGYFEGKPLGLKILGGRMAPFPKIDKA